MASQPRSKAVIELGKRLAAELDRDADLAAAWISHLLAEKIKSAEVSGGPSQAAAEKECVELILELWRHRANIPEHRRPFREMAPFLRVMESLDLEPNEHRYFRPPPGPMPALPSATQHWLQFSTDVDYTARLLIRLGLGAALAEADAGSEEWVRLAMESAADDQPEGPIVRFFRAGDARSSPTTGLEMRIKKLREFAKLSEELVVGLEKMLAKEKRRLKKKKA